MLWQYQIAVRLKCLLLDFSADLISAQEHRVQRWALVCGPL